MLEGRRRSHSAITDRPQHRGSTGRVRADLVEYLIVTVADGDALAGVGLALAQLVEGANIRILDLVVLERGDDGTVTALELEAVDGLGPLRELDIEVGGMLSEHDLELASFALQPGKPAVVIVTEDLWAEPLSVAARRAGGQIVAGERIPAARVEAALADRPDYDEPGPGS